MRKVAILHDCFLGYGGATYDVEQMALALDAPIYTAYMKDIVLDENVKVTPFKQHKYLDSFYSRFLQNAAIQMLLLKSDFQKLKLNGYDVVISSGILSRAYKPTKGQYTINYPRSPPRWLYDLHDYHMSSFNPIKRMLAEIYCWCFKRWDVSVLNNIDLIVANSEVVQKRIKRYWNRDSVIIYPPVEISKYRHKDDEEYYLSLGRLDKLKRIDLIITVFKKLDYKLKIAGAGLDEERLKTLAEGCDNIEFCGFVDEEDKIDLLSRCKGLVFTAMNEDFGLVVVEALASGKPVITVNEGYPPHIIKSEVNGLIIEPTVESLSQAISRCEQVKWDPDKIRESVKKYDVKRFRKEWKNLIEKVRLS